MDEFDSQFDDVVIFELPAFEDVEAFTDRFRPSWAGWVHADTSVWLFSAYLSGTDGELSRLLRGAQELVAELGLAVIRFYLDGKVYVLERATQSAPATNTVLYRQT